MYDGDPAHLPDVIKKPEGPCAVLEIDKHRIHTDQNLSMRAFLTSAAAYSALLFATANANPVKRNDSSMVENWKDIKPTTDLEWVPCFENFTCAVLEV